MPHYVIDLKSISDRIANVIDVQFLHGYHEPTLLILFESLRTWPGCVEKKFSMYYAILLF